MRLLLFRHGPAGERDPIRWPDDRVRPLSPKGIAKTERVVRGLMSLAPDIGIVFTSPLVRSRETAERLAGVAGLKARELESLAPGGSWRETLDALERESAGTVALVGHEPDLGKLAGVLLFGAPRALPLKKAGACLIECPKAPAAGQGELVSFAGPRLLRAMPRRKART